ncbi:acetylornithine deacetylase [Sedimentitalea sp. JM2-8]|uniref:Acetylornithine deacetylase n=1 Tax=Sedimentitalea xiamensis TaxID=3050037 RepID=A0ABT7F9U3_9RHOB|nr:acetylornithine deacetylase [Sedimentitalea xiamensis]MDK3071624.1 acetylornithine deacetylase [Sedimentitalea xiamensis]
MSGRLEETVEFLARLIGYPTVSSDGNLAMIAELASRLEDSGARVDLFETPDGGKANLFATLGPDAPGGLVLSGHTDVVPVADQDWNSDPFMLHESGGRLYGRGSCDMKGFIAAATVKARDLANLDLRRPVHFAFTYDEEVGCLGARSLVLDLQRRGLRPSMAIIGEPTRMRVIEGHKGCCEYTVRFSGLEGHGSSPHRGVNAAEYAVQYVTELMRLRGELMLRAPQGSRYEPPWTTLNVGRVSGGVAHNVIAGKAEVDWEMRPVQDSDFAFVKAEMARVVDERLLPMMRAVHPQADIVTDVIGEVVGLEVLPENAARDLVAGLVGANGADVVSFGTEAGLFQQMGMSVAVCGPGSIEQAHKPDEFVSLDQMRSCLDMLDRLCRSPVLVEDAA